MELNKNMPKKNIIDDLKFRAGNFVLEARIEAGLTQKELAKLIGTKQPSIARVENCSILPSLEFLEKIAKAVGCGLEFRLSGDTQTTVYDATSEEGMILSPYPYKSVTANTQNKL